MRFYLFEGTVFDKQWIEGGQERSESRRRGRSIYKRSRAFNQRNGSRAFFCTAEASEETARICAAVFDPDADADELAAAYIEEVGLKQVASDFESEEITFKAFEDLLRTADYNDCISDDQDVLASLRLDSISSMFRRDEFEESMAELMEKVELYNSASNCYMKGTLIPELDRIYSGKALIKGKGHPVHYMLSSDDHGALEELSGLLISALFANGRLASRRYCTVAIDPDEKLYLPQYDALYNSCAGGTVIVDYLDEADPEGEHASACREVIEQLCAVMRKYRHRVLTVFRFPGACAKTKSIFYEYLGNTGFVEISDEPSDFDKAKEYLRSKARKAGVRVDGRLLSMMKAGELYTASELQRLFEDWLDAKLKRDVYPQYRKISPADKAAAKARPKGSAYEELCSMIGLGEAKKVIDLAINHFKAQSLFKSKGMKRDIPALHMVFTGNPGTAKTTVARLFARILKENGILPGGSFIECGRSDIVGRYVGWTAQIVKNKFSKAKGGVLFIDEAYSLVDGHSGSFGDEAINTIVQEMENHREDVVVILAGYPDQMEDLLSTNPGLRSRIAFHVHFDDYSAEDLCAISKHIAGSKGLRLTDGALEKLGAIFSEARLQADFGNGRYARNLIEHARMAQSTRLLAMDPDRIGKRELETICEEDIEMLNTAAPDRRHLGFCA